MIYLQLFLAFIKIGTFGFGGGIAMLPLIYQNAAHLSGMSEQEFSNLVAISQMTPGPIAVNAATYVGYDTAGLPGALIATFGVALPSFILVVLACIFIVKFKESVLVQGMLEGIRPMVAGLIFSAFLFLAAQAITPVFGPRMMIELAICGASCVLLGKFKISPLIIVAGAGVIGALILS